MSKESYYQAEYLAKMAEISFELNLEETKTAFSFLWQSRQEQTTQVEGRD